MFQLKKGGLCPQCEKGVLKEVVKDLEFKYKDGLKVFHQEKVFACDLCGCEVLTQEATKRVDKALLKFRQSINSRR